MRIVVVYIWARPRTGESEVNAHEAGCHLLDQLAEDYDHLGTADVVIPDLVDELMARETETGGKWHGRAAALDCVLEGVIQSKALEAARDN